MNKLFYNSVMQIKTLYMLEAAGSDFPRLLSRFSEACFSLAKPGKLPGPLSHIISALEDVSVVRAFAS